MWGEKKKREENITCKPVNVNSLRFIVDGGGKPRMIDNKVIEC